MKLFRTILFVAFYVFSTISLVAQKKYTKGAIYNQADSSIISHAHIINTSSKIGVTSNQKGEFSIPTKQEDTLIISFVGYHSLKISVLEIETNIYLKRAIHTIEPYIVLPYKDFKEFREAFTKLEIKDTVKHKINPSIMAFIKPFNPNKINGGISFEGPISSLAALFNKRIKDKKNYDKLLARDKYKAFLATKFNAKTIKQSTTLKEGHQINSFMKYCDFTDQFIELSSQYDLVNQIIVCFMEYNSLPIANR